MADISGITAPVDFGPLLTSFGRGEADIANTQANTALTASQKTGADIANAKAAWQLKGLQNLVSQATANGQQSAQQAAAPVNSGAADQSGVAQQPEILPGGEINKNGIYAAVNATHQQLPYVPTAKTAGVMAASSAYGAPEFGQAAMMQEKAGWDRDMQARLVSANNLYDQALKVHGDDPAGAWARMGQVSPGMAAQLKANGDANGWTPAQLDQHAADWAETVGGAAFRHTGRDVVDKNGVAYDAKTGMAVLGGEQAVPSATALAEYGKNIDTLVPMDVVGGGTRMVPGYVKAGYPSHAAMIAAEFPTVHALQQAAAGTLQQPPPPPVPHEHQNPAGKDLAPLATAHQNVASTAAAAKDPVGEGIKDPSWTIKDYPTTAQQNQFGTGSKAQTEAMASYEPARLKLLTNTGAAAVGAATSNSYLDAAKQVLASGGDITGAGSALKAKIDASAAKLGISSGDYSTRYQEVAKDLAQSAWNSAASIPGGPTQGQTELMSHINPSTAHTPAAVANLIDQIHRQNDYVISAHDNAIRYTDYRGPHGERNDPNKFPDFQVKYTPRSEATALPKEAPPVRVRSPSGKTGTIPAAQLDAALAAGYVKAK